MKLRDYQSKALEAISADLNVPGASVCVLPTGSGKSHIIAAAALLKRPVLILVPSRELLQQNHDKLALVVPADEIGIYSASFNRREIKTFTLATIQSVYKKPELFQDVKLVICDECHGINIKDLGTMYSFFLKAIGNPKIIGLTASPIRAVVGYFRHPDKSLEQTTMIKMINRTRHKDARDMFWKRIIHVTHHRDLAAQGYLVPLKYSTNALVPYSEIKVNISHSDFLLDSYAKNIIGHEAVILNTISDAQRRHSSVLVFCSTTEQAEHLSSIVKDSVFVTAKTPKKERDKIVRDFRGGRVKTCFNMGIFLTGFDFPGLSCIVNIRPTRSPALYLQMMGRVCRPFPGKIEGEVIDLTGTVNEMGPIEEFEFFQKDGWQWDLKSQKCDGWHNKILYSMKVQE